MKLLIAFAVSSLMIGCVVEDQHRNCARNERWDGHHCMVDRAHDHDHDHDRDHAHDHDHDHHDGEGGVEVR